MRRLRNDMEAAGIPIENSKGEAGPGQEEINVRYAEAARHGRPACHPEERRQGDRRPDGQGDHLHGEVQLRPRRQFQPHPQFAVERRQEDAALPRQEGPVGLVQRSASNGPLGKSNMPANTPASSRPISIPTSASRSRPGRRPASSGAATTAPPASACAAKAPKACAWSAASAAPTSILISPSRR